MRIESATFKIEEVASMLGISRNSTYQLAREGKLPGVIRLGRRIVVSRRAIDEMLAPKLKTAAQPDFPGGSK